MTVFLSRPIRFALVALVFLVGCQSSTEEEALLQKAVAIESSDECHLCGMVISNFPGPKGELFKKGEQTVHKFCSNRDLFSYLLQPENRHRATQIFVHDMAIVPWAHPSDDEFIDAKSAWYVHGSNKKAAMGPALASFSSEHIAHQFAKKFGGEVLEFDDITLELLGSEMDMAETAHGHHGH